MTHYNAESVAGELLGTDSELAEVVGSHLLENPSFLWELREFAIRCKACGYWFEPEELDAEDLCADDESMEDVDD